MKPPRPFQTTLVLLAITTLALSAAPASAASTDGASGRAAASTINPSPPDAAAAADAFMARRSHTLHATARGRFTRTTPRKGTDGLQYFPYSRKHAGLPVVGGDVVVATNARGDVIDTNVGQAAAISVPTKASIPAAKAVRAARARLTSIDRVGQPRLVVTAVGAAHLAWEVLVTGRNGNAPSAKRVFVDAITGNLVGEYDEVSAGTGHGYYSGPDTTFPTTATGETYRMIDSTHPGVSCSDQGSQPFSGPDDVWGDGSGTSLESACVDVLHAVDKEWQMLDSWLDRDGIDGKGHGFPARVGLSAVNAYWYGDYAQFGHSFSGIRQATAIDVVGHEYGHGIYGTTGLGGTAALNEGAADIFGTLTEFYADDPTDTPDYLLGERVNFRGSGPLRSMYDPASVGGGANCWTPEVETMEPHAGAGVLDHWFYLIAEGSAPVGKDASPICAGGPAALVGLGQLSAAKIFYNALQMKSYSWTYADARITTLQAARNLYPDSCTEYTRVKDAWNAVAVPAQVAEPTCPDSAGTFGISLPSATGSTTAGHSATFLIDTNLNVGTGRQVTLSASGLPTGASVDFVPARVMASATSQATVSVPTTVPGGTYSITFKGVSGAEAHSVTATLIVEAWRDDDFSITAPTATMSLRAGQTGSLDLVTGITRGSPGSLALSVDKRTLPDGASVSFEPTFPMAGEGSTVRVKTHASTPPGTYPLIITAAGTFSTHTVTVSYTVLTPNLMEFDVPTEVIVPAGTSKAVPITSTVLSGNAETVTWAMSPEVMPPGVTASFNPPTGLAGDSTTLTLTVAASVPADDYYPEVTGTTASELVNRRMRLTVTAATGFCTGYATSNTGTIAAGATQNKPSFTAVAGAHKVCLDGPTDVDFDLYLQKQSSTGGWTTVASATTAAADEKLAYSGTAGTYRYRVVAYSGSGDYTLAYNRP